MGQWLCASDYQRLERGLRLNKYDWLRAEPEGREHLSPADLQRGPQQIVWHGQPFFVVPDDWLARARAITQQDFAELRGLYESAVYELLLDGRALTLRVGELISEPINGFVITAYNPGHSRPTAEQNHHRHQALYRHLLQCGYAVQPALGRSVDGLHEEPSWWVQGASWLQLRAVAQAYAQRAVLELNQGRCRLRWV